MEINEGLFIAVIILLMVIAFLVLPQYLYKRATRGVIKILAKNNCFNAATAKTPSALGLAQRGWIANLGRSRDYKPRALQMLIEYNIVLKTNDDRVYIDKEKAALYRLGNLFENEKGKTA